MNRLLEGLYSVTITLWVGGLLVTGYVVAPVLFAQLSDRTLAGNLAGTLFAVMAWVGLACGIYLFCYLMGRHGWKAFRTSVFWIVLMMLVLTVIGQFGIQPILVRIKADALPRQVMESALRNRFAAWHGISSGLYLVQSLLGLWLVIWQERGKR
ncbi:MAG: DUF4149 domain-containing protein [Proteobacteria bacterium]|nr:DUF4149 domain-containing protein [Pseudomonadota bacterium]HQR02935.1 DUF4149 domain-containing protein [Rhodocyclaceae bacterium]